MSNELDRRLRQLAHEIADAAPSAHDWSTVGTAAAPSPRRPTGRVLAAAACVMALLGVVVLVLTRSDPDRVVSIDAPPAVPDSVESPAPAVPGSVESPAQTAPPDATTVPRAETTVAATTTASAAAPLCFEPVEVIVRTLAEARVAGDTSAPCVAIPGFVDTQQTEPPCWSVCANGRRVTFFDVEQTSIEWENPVEGASGRSAIVRIDYFSLGADGESAIELWELTYTESGALQLTSVSLRTDGPTEEQAVVAVTDYLGALADGRYDDAAGLWDDGAVNWDERPDLAALPAVPGVDGLSLAEALRDWCDAGAACERPDTVSAEQFIGGWVRTVTVVFDIDGHSVVATFELALVEGRLTIRGLPPLARASSLPTLAESLAASTLIAQHPSGVSVWHDGQRYDVPVPPGAWSWSDGSYIFSESYISTDSADGRTRSTAASLDGTVVCVVDGSIHRLRQRDDGGYMASVERPEEAPSAVEETPLPNYAVDCQTGATEPIDPVSWWREGGYRAIVQVGDRTFIADGDAEGNADVVNESGISINGDDYAGSHTYNDDGSRVVYGDYGVTGHPHETTVIRSRDTTTGELLWSAELDTPFSRLAFFGDRLLVTHQPRPGIYEFDTTSATEYISIHDATTGEHIKDIPTTLNILEVG